jgi:hypothetical protein
MAWFLVKYRDKFNFTSKKYTKTFVTVKYVLG